jgi:hypothetical protein
VIYVPIKIIVIVVVMNIGWEEKDRGEGGSNSAVSTVWFIACSE